jgi:hypothetical protein
MMRWRIQSIALTILLVAAAGLARADGYQPRKAAAPPVMLQVTNWTGFYANGGLGYGFWHAPNDNRAVGRTVLHLRSTRSRRPRLVG